MRDFVMRELVYDILFARFCLRDIHRKPSTLGCTVLTFLVALLAQTGTLARSLKKFCLANFSSFFKITHLPQTICLAQKYHFREVLNLSILTVNIMHLLFVE